MQQRAVMSTVMFGRIAAGAAVYGDPLGKLIWAGSAGSDLLSVGARSVLTFLQMAEFSSTTVPHTTWRSNLGICCKSSVGKRWTFLHITRIWHPGKFIGFTTWKSACPDFLHQRWRRQMCYRKMPNAMATYVLRVRGGKKLLMLWEESQFWRTLRWKIIAGNGVNQ